MNTSSIDNDIENYDDKNSITAHDTSIPCISVVMPTFNAAQYLREAVDSILAQTFIDFEFLIVDDNSTDETLDILNSYNDSRIRIIQGPQRGIAAALNCGIREARGTYIARMDADDVSFPNRFSRQVEFMDTHPDIGICGSIARLSCNDWGKWVWDTIENPHICDILIDTPFCHPTVFFRKSCIEKYNLLYNENYSHAEDQELWFRAIKFIKFYNIQEELLMYRIHKNNKSITNKKKDESALRSIRKNFMDWFGIKCTAKNVNDIIQSLLWFVKNDSYASKENIDVLHQYIYYKKRYYLFGKIPILKVRKTNMKLEFYLFGFICILKIKSIPLT